MTVPAPVVWAFLGLLALHVLHGIVQLGRGLIVRLRRSDATSARTDAPISDVVDPAPAPQRRTWLDLVGGLAQIPLFYIGLYVAYLHGDITRELISPLHIAVGAAAGHVLFTFALVLIHRAVRDAWRFFLDLPGLWNFALRSPIVLGRFIMVAVTEEIIWRAGLQTLLLGLAGAWFAGASAPGWAVALGVVSVTALLFTLTHRHMADNSLSVSLEFVLFAFLLGLIYHATSSLILVVAIHAVRDIEVSYLEYAAKADELGDEDRAAEEIERALLNRPHPENP